MSLKFINTQDGICSWWLEVSATLQVRLRFLNDITDQQKADLYAHKFHIHIIIFILYDTIQTNSYD
jgi:hypothetical protein